MSKFRFSKTSLARLNTCDQRLIDLMQTAIDDELCPVDFMILEGKRPLEKQIEYVRLGYSKTMKSRHLLTPSRAVDVAPYPLDWGDLYRFRILAEHIKNKAVEIGVEVEWGGDWKTFVDMPHWQVGD